MAANNHNDDSPCAASEQGSQTASNPAIMFKEKDQIIDFVRHTLGCTCPDEVFEKIEMEDSRFAAAPYERKITIGEKLLIYIKWVDFPDSLNEQLPVLLSEGKTERDRKGLNRFRAVLVSDKVQTVSDAAVGIFNAFSGKDEKIHLHVVDSKEIWPTSMAGL